MALSGTLELIGPTRRYSFEVEDQKAASIKGRMAEVRKQSDRRCNVPGCGERAAPYSLTPWCQKHLYRNRFVGHPWVQIPYGADRKAARQAVLGYLEGLSERDRQRFQALLTRAIKTLHEPKSNALKPAKAKSISPTLTLRGKAQIIIAHLNQRRDWERVATRLLIEAMTLELWAACWWPDTKKKLPRFLNTRIGKVATWLARPSLKETVTRWTPRGDREVTEVWKPSDPVVTAVGKRFNEALREIIPRWWVSDSLITKTIELKDKLENE